MLSLNNRHTIYLTLLVLGAYAQIAQALLVRESLVVFYGNEVSLGVFFASWLFWIGVGSAGVNVMRKQRWFLNPVPLLRILILSLPLLLTLQTLAMRSVRALLEVSSTEFVPLGDLLLSVFIINLPASLALGMAFPLACRRLSQLTGQSAGHPPPPGSAGVTPALSGQDGRIPGTGELKGERLPVNGLQATVGEVSRLYIFEALGALLGGVLFTFVLIEWLGVWRTVGTVATLLAVTGLSLSEGRAGLKLTAAGIAIAGLLLAATPLGSVVHRHMESWRFTTLQPGLELLDSVETRYGHVALARYDQQISVVADGRISESFPDRQQAEQEAAYLYTQSNGARRVLMLGGIAGGLAEELLRYPVERLEIIVEDRSAFENLRPHLLKKTRKALADPRVTIHFEDGRRIVRRLSPVDKYDLVLVLTADPSSAHNNRYFTLEFYRTIRSSMSDKGVLCTGVSSASNYLGRDVSSYSGSVFRTLSVIFPHLAIAPGDRHLYCASPTPGQVSEEPRTLVQRYLDTPLDQHRFPAQSFYSLLPADRIAFVREQLASEHGEINSDSVPVTYFLNMVLWGKFSASGFVVWMDTLRHMGLWPYLVPLTLFVLLMLLRTSLEGDSRPIRYRQSATFTLFILGLIAMAAQLALLFSYQSHVGFVFSRIALLNGLFMTGLALGAGGIGHRLTLGSRPGINLILVMVLVAAALGALPMLLPALARLDPTHQEGVYLLLSTLAGLLTGMGFPLGVRLAHPDGNDVLRTSGIIEAADHLGGALGGLLTGALLVPTLGIPMTFYLLAAVAVITLFPLLHAEYSPTNIPALRERGHRSFPLPTLSWGIAWGVLTLFIVVLLARGTAPGAIVHFNNATLAEVSSSKSFELRNQPMPHYLGTGAVVGGETATEPGGTTPAAAAQRYHPDATVSLATATVASNVRGYAGPINLLVAVDRQGILRGAQYIQSDETPSYIENIDQWLNGLAGLDLSSVPLSLDGVDALSGATVTSQAALESINRAVSAGGDAAFQLSFAPTSASGSSKIITVKFIITALLLLLFFPIYHSGGNAVRLIYQGAVLVILGFWFNTLVTEIDLVNISVGHLPSWSSNPQRYLLLGFTLIITLLYGQAYCGYVCPFGAMQEFISRIGRFFRLRSYIIKELDTRARYLKFLILALMLSLFWATDEPLWASFNPMQHLFAIDFSGWMVPIVLFSLAGALFYYRFWCRYFCPFGAFLALFNKVALAKAITPARDFKRCDLGVREEYDVDCIHCHRCISGKDCGQRTRENK